MREHANGSRRLLSHVRRQLRSSTVVVVVAVMGSLRERSWWACCADVALAAKVGFLTSHCGDVWVTNCLSFIDDGGRRRRRRRRGRWRRRRRSAPPSAPFVF